MTFEIISLKYWEFLAILTILKKDEISAIEVFWEVAGAYLKTTLNLLELIQNKLLRSWAQLSISSFW